MEIISIVFAAITIIGGRTDAAPMQCQPNKKCEIVMSVPTPTPLPLAGANCRSGILTEHRVIESVLSVLPHRRDDNVDGYIGAYREDVNKYFIMSIPDGRQFYVKSVDAINQNHMEEHKKLWGDTWLADIDVRFWDSIGRPPIATICKVKETK